MTGSYAYTAYELVVHTPFPCPALRPAPAGGGSGGSMVVVEEGPVPRSLDAPTASGGWWEAQPGRLLVRGGRRAGRFVVDGSARVVVQRGPASEDARLASCLVKWVLPAVLRHRGVLVLHASAALTPRGLVVIAGESGAGKSTALAALMARGCAMSADDVVVLRAAPSGDMEALPGVAQLRLSAASAQAVGQDVGDLRVGGWPPIKAVVSTEAMMVSGPATVVAVYVLRTTGDDQIRFTPLEGGEKFEALVGCLYGPLLGGEDRAHFGPLASLAGRICVTRAERPARRWSVDELATALLTGSH